MQAQHRPGRARGFPPADQPAHVYLSDFGISKRPLSDSGLTTAGQLVGTLDYIAPEQINGRAVDGRADLYSLGCADTRAVSYKTMFGKLWNPVAARYSLPPASVSSL